MHYNGESIGVYILHFETHPYQQMSDISGSGDFFERDPYSKDFSKLSNVFSAVDHIQPIFCSQTCGEYLAHLADKIGSAEPAEVWQDMTCRHMHVAMSAQSPPEIEALHDIYKPPEQHKVPFIHISPHV